MKTAHVCFLWHMHQPYYTDPVSRSVSMPWVRLHASKAYYDMAALLERHPDVRMTFNFTPSLLRQLNELVSGSVTDLFLDYAQRPAADLTLAERAFVLRHFFAANWATMVRPFPRYHELLVKRGLDVRGHDLEPIARSFTAQEFLDLQVWHNLAWFGYGAVARYPRLAALRIKDRGFTEEQKVEVLAIQQQVLAEIIPLYRKLADAGQIELTTTPYYHPILPLVIDTDIAHRCQPDASLPARFQARVDAERQLRLAVSQHADLFGAPPRGLWPSEGSVCPEMVPLVRHAGLRWMATDEGVLARSMSQWNRAEDLYQPYVFGQDQQELSLVFRDRELSDAFGFVYSKWGPDSAVEDVLSRLRAIADHGGNDHQLIAVILDGENPWEHYHEGGERFLGGLYAALRHGLRTSTRTVETKTISASLAERPPTRRLNRLHSGSWINADYKIWIGHPEDNRGWDLLRETRTRLLEAESSLSSTQAREAWDEIYAAEGSDWFWWYGDDFHTDYKVEFDRLFRTHLRNVFLRIGRPAPAYLDDPIVSLDGAPDVQSVRYPVRLLCPILDGEVTNFFEWRGAGDIDPAPPLGAMWRASGLFTFLGFGYNLEALCFRFDVVERNLRPGLAVEILVATERRPWKMTFFLERQHPNAVALWRGEGQHYEDVSRLMSLARGKIIELLVPFTKLELSPRDRLSFTIIVTDEGREIERYPRHHPVSLTVPDESFEVRMWRV